MGCQGQGAACSQHHEAGPRAEVAGLDRIVGCRIEEVQVAGVDGDREGLAAGTGRVLVELPDRLTAHADLVGFAKVHLRRVETE